jgi:hypothetical protein
MTPEKLAELVAAGESLDVEFKGEKSSPLNDRALVEAVVCLANRPGEATGWLLVGVEDDGQITGARPRHEGGITDPLRVQALIANRTRPALTCRAERIELHDKQILAIEVPASRQPVGTTEGLYLRRALGVGAFRSASPFTSTKCRHNRLTAGCWITLPSSYPRLAGKTWTPWSSIVSAAASGRTAPWETAPCSTFPTRSSPSARRGLRQSPSERGPRSRAPSLRHRRGPPALSSHSRGSFPGSFGTCGGSQRIPPLAPAPQHGGGSRPVQGPQPRGRGSG